MPPSRDTLEKLLNRRDLSELESEDLLLQLTDPPARRQWRAPSWRLCGPRGSLRTKYADSPVECVGLRAGRRSRLIYVASTCRNGGDASGSLNIQQVPRADCCVRRARLKHGNRSVSAAPAVLTYWSIGSEGSVG